MIETIFDIETNGEYKDVDTIHCIALKRIGIDKEVLLFDTIQDNIQDAIDILSNSDRLIGHNIIAYDIPVLEKLYPTINFTHNVFDTFNLSYIRFPDRSKHGLDSWGEDLGFSKFNPITGKEYTKEELKEKKKIKADAWSKYTPEMGIYCKQDVKITELVLWKCNPYDLPSKTLDLSNKFAWIIGEQINNGCRIDKEKLQELAAKIEIDELEAKDNLLKILPNFIDYDFKVYKRNNKNKNIKAGEIECVEIVTTFNLKSTYHWMRFLKDKYNYEPPLVRRKGKDEPTPSLDDEVLASIENDYPEIKDLLQYKAASKIRGMIYSDPNSVYNKLDENNIIRGKVYTEGTVSGRCSHNQPNLATMPGVRKDKDGNIIQGFKGKYAYEVRDLFIPRPGFTQIGFDAKALEVCCLAHYVNNKEFTDQVENGDIHTWTKNKAGLNTRQQAKTFMYAFLYGAGKAKLAKALSEGSDKVYTTKTVTQVIDNFHKALPGLTTLLNRLQDEYEQYQGITGLDGRLLQARSNYILLNLLLQSSGAVIMKQCLVFLKEELDKVGLKRRVDYNFTLNIHDEVQAEVRKGLEDVYKECCYKAVDRTNEFLKLNCRLQIDIKQGKSWAECH